MSTVIPEGMTDPDEIDAWLEARDGHARLAVLDAAVMAGYRHRDAVTNENMIAGIRARRDYDAKPPWERLRIRLRGETPAGLIDRHPTGPLFR